MTVDIETIADRIEEEAQWQAEINGEEMVSVSNDSFKADFWPQMSFIHIWPVSKQAEENVFSPMSFSVFHDDVDVSFKCEDVPVKIFVDIIDIVNQIKRWNTNRR